MAETKDTLLSYFSGLDISTLEKLKKYSKLLIIPDEDLLTNATMSQMVGKAHSLADSLFPEWTDRSKSDFGEFLVELFALYSEKDFWYINAFANEGIFRKMRSYSNAFSKASSFGYNAVTCKGAKANFRVTFDKGQAVTYYRGDLIIKSEGLEFSNDEPITIEESSAYISKTITLSEGKQVTEDATFNGHSIYLSRPKIDFDSIEVVIDNVSFSRVNNFGDSMDDSCHFLVLPEEDGSCSIFFGKDGFGVQPALGKIITVSYRTCSGSEGNSTLETARVQSSLEDRKAASVNVLTNSTGGVDPETLTSIKEQAPAYFAFRRAAMNEVTAESILNSYQFVHKSKVWNNGTEVYYSVIPTSGDAEPSESERLYMQQVFEPCLMLGFTGTYVQNSYVDINTRLGASKVILDVIISAGYDAATIESSVRQVMDDITNPLIGATYGQTFSKSEIEIKIRSEVPGVQSVSFKKLVSGIESVIEDFFLGNAEIFSKINQDNLTIRINAI